MSFRSKKTRPTHLLISNPLSLEIPPRKLQNLLPNIHLPIRLQLIHPSLQHLRSLHSIPAVRLSGEVPQQPLEVTRHQDIHRRSDGYLDSSYGSYIVRINLLVPPRLPEPSEDVVGVRGDDEFPTRKTELLGVVSSEDVSEVSCGDDELDFGGGREGEVGVEVVDDLSEDSSPVDRVDGPEAVSRVEERIREEGFDSVLYTKR